MKKPIPFGKYILLDRINVGGMAEVFKAKSFGVEGFERFLAVKRILPNISEDKDFIDMFKDEAKISVQLNHANIAQIFDLGIVDGSYFIALEYITGKDLRAIFDRCRALAQPMPIIQACFIIMKVCEGLDYAHNKRDSSGREMNIVHRDISPQNILISYEGDIKLVDFGIAKAVGKASKTQAGILKGKFGYMSPEQVRGLPLDRRSDIFSVGIVLYELITGERLFSSESDFSTLEKVRNAEILPPSTYNRKIPEGLEQIILKALAKDVEDRYQDAIDLHDELQAFMFTTQQHYTRKDLANWMKKLFVKEIEEEERKQEEHRLVKEQQVGQLQTPAPQPFLSLAGKISSPGDVLEAPSVDGLGPSESGDSTPAYDTLLEGQKAAARANREFLLEDESIGEEEEDQKTPSPKKIVRAAGDKDTRPNAMAWEEEEIETQIFDKPGASGKARPASDSDELSLASQSANLTQERPSQVFGLPWNSAQEGVTGGKRQRRNFFWMSFFICTLLICASLLYYFLLYSKRPGSLNIVAIPADVDVFIDGRRQPTTGTPMTINHINPGVYVIAVTKVGYERWTKEVELRPGEAVQLAPQLEPLPTGTIELRSAPKGADVYLDGRRLSGSTPIRISQIAPGKHRLEVEKSPYQRWIHDFELESEKTLSLFAKLLPQEMPVQISSNPPAEVFILQDSMRKSLGITPVNLSLNPKNSYLIELQRHGYKTWVGPIKFDGEEPAAISVNLEREERGSLVTEGRVKGQSPLSGGADELEENPWQDGSESKKMSKATGDAPDMGTLLINTTPWTSILIDGRDTGLTTPQKRIPLPVGRHLIRLRNTKFKIDETIQVEIRANQPTKLIKTFSVRSSSAATPQ